MCGFLCYFGEHKELRPKLEKSLEMMRHRGPDDSAVRADATAWMGFRRLAILDLSKNGRQPMDFANGRYTLCFNGEIYNHLEIRELIKNDFDFRSHSDSETLGAAISLLGINKTLSKLRGMFAFTWLDRKTEKITLARDHFGIKPLYYFHAKNILATSSEFVPLLQALRAKHHLELNPERLAEYFTCGSVATPNSFCPQIKSLPPANKLSFDIKKQRITTSKYWQISWQISSNEKTAADYFQEVREKVIASTRRHLISDVPVGVFLSGGLDSSVLCAAMRQISPDAKIQAFSLGWSDEDKVADESKIAENTARHLGVEFNVLRLTPQKMLEQAEQYLNSMDQPTGDGVNVYTVSKFAAENVKVCLSGLGADEMLAGYGHHRMLSIAQKAPLFKILPRNICQRLAEVYNILPQEIRSQPLARLCAMASGALGNDIQEIVTQARSVFTTTQLRKLLPTFKNTDDKQRFNPLQFSLKKDVEKIAGSDAIHQALLYEIRGYMLGVLLRDSDNFSMTHSIELRVPFVDVDFFEACATLPSSLKVNAHEGKIALRNSFADLLPQAVSGDKRKKGFNLPMMKWLKDSAWQDKINASLDNPNAEIYNWLDRKECEQYKNTFFTGKNVSKLAYAHYQRLWLIFVLEEWLQKLR